MNIQVDVGRGPAAPKREAGRERIGVALVGVGGAVALRGPTQVDRVCAS